MKNMGEGIAVGLVILLTFGLVGLIVQYNMIDTEEAMVYDTQIKQSLESETVKKESKVSSYLDKLEGYEDVDVKVDMTAETKEDTTNIAVVETEVGKEDVIGDIGSAVQTVEKREDYVDNLEHYDPNAVVVAKQKEAVKKEEVQEKTPEEELKSDPVGDIVSDIDSIIDASM
jgi:hypothetical protein